jgi:hypothetical protein
MSEYLLPFQGNDWQKSLSPDETEKAMIQWTDWFDWLRRQGKLRDSSSLTHEGRLVSGKKGTVNDERLTQCQEAIAGYSLLQVNTFDEAMEIAKKCPVLDYGSTIAVRKIASPRD